MATKGGYKGVLQTRPGRLEPGPPAPPPKKNFRGSFREHLVLCFIVKRNFVEYLDLVKMETFSVSYISYVLPDVNY